MLDVMCDLETLGNSAGCAILSIGAVAFDPEAGRLGDEFYQVIGVTSCVVAGMTFDQGTLDWWGQQSPEAREVLRQAYRADATPLNEALCAFSRYLHRACGGAPPRLWGNGADFDNAILASAYKAARIAAPWKFWDSRCYRTLKGLHPETPLQKRTGVHHNALDDAKTQAEHALQIFAKRRPGDAQLEALVKIRNDLPKLLNALPRLSEDKARLEGERDALTTEVARLDTRLFLERGAKLTAISERDDARAGRRLLSDQAHDNAATILEIQAERDALKARVAELEGLINAPELHDFSRGVVLEAAHQRQRWGADHDAGKTPWDWFWLVGYLAQKAGSAAVSGDSDKACHHTISTGAALANWHAALSGADTSMRPGIAPAELHAALPSSTTPSRGQTGRACAAPGPGFSAPGPGAEPGDAA